MIARTPRPLVALAVGAAAFLIAWLRHRSAARTAAAAAWSDVPSAPDWYVPRSNGAELAISRYDELRAVDIAAAVRRLQEPDEVRQVLEYEKAHNRRVTVFKAAKARLRALEAAEPMAAR